ncbi:virulence RhuM family protein [Devosia elaeis]|uniref:Cell filamentation protein Fic n=1 Tax=Devosia elaeis TaxID=1770058 RepID=A0A178HWA0_9HYPH|nr:virulence RhuM family protein [Devosia elaeis]OAM77141.1 cell filamentation protein Fic [Devosia elaeis]
MADKPTPREGEILLYTGTEGDIRVEVLFEDDSFWLTQKRMGELFEVTVPTISYHLKEIFESGELVRERTVRKFLTVQTEGSREVAREVEFYNLDAIIAVGYRVNSRQATQFRIWATSVLREYIVKGFALDDERLKLNRRLGKDYFDELLERIREIRASERRFYLKITDIYEQCSIDYSKDAEVTQTFFRTVQNKLHWAITGQTAAEIIKDRADASKPNMGLQTWKNAPDGKILKSDVSIAKNYMREEEMKALERVVSMYLDYAENQAARQIPMRMTDWVGKLDAFLTFNEYEILKDAGRVSHAVAKALAEKEYDVYRPIQDRAFESDFEREATRAIEKAKSSRPRKRKEGEE